MSTPATTVRSEVGDLVETLDSVQYSLGEGPCVHALREPGVAALARLPAAGLRSQLAVKLYVDDDGILGSINFYSATSDEIDPDAEHIADLFAAHAAIALENARERDNLNEALQSRKVIRPGPGNHHGALRDE